MKILPMNWERLDAMTPYDLYGQFDYIREDAECQGFEDDFESVGYVEAVFQRDFPNIWDKIKYDDIEVEYYDHEIYEDDDAPTYSVYIHVNEKFRNVVKEEYPEYYL